MLPERRRHRRPAGYGIGAVCGKSIGVRLKELFAKVGSYYAARENFRLTREVKARFTEELKADPTKLESAEAAAEKFVMF